MFTAVVVEQKTHDGCLQQLLLLRNVSALCAGFVLNPICKSPLLFSLFFIVFLLLFFCFNRNIMSESSICLIPFCSSWFFSLYLIFTSARLSLAGNGRLFSLTSQLKLGVQRWFPLLRKGSAGSLYLSRIQPVRDSEIRQRHLTTPSKNIHSFLHTG